MKQRSEWDMMKGIDSIRQERSLFSGLYISYMLDSMVPTTRKTTVHANLLPAPFDTSMLAFSEKHKQRTGNTTQPANKQRGTG